MKMMINLWVNFQKFCYHFLINDKKKSIVICDLGVCFYTVIW